MKHVLSLFALLIIAGQSYGQNLLAQARSVETNKWGYINTSGEFVIEPQIGISNPFTADGLAPSTYIKSRKSFYFIKTNGEELKTDLEKFVLMNFKGFNPKGFHDGMAPVQVDNRWGYMNAEGKLAVEAKYDKAREFYGDHGVTAIGKKFFVISRTGGETLIDLPELADVRHFSENLAPVSAGGLWGFIGTDGSIVVKPTYKAVGYFSNGLAWAKAESGQIGFINKQGEWVIEPKFNAVKDFTTDGIAQVKSDSWGFVDMSGKMLTIPEADSYGEFSDGLAYAKTGKLIGFFNKEGAMVIEQKFDDVRDFKNGYASAKQGDKWGFIDTNGSWVIEPKFISVKDFEATSR